MNNWKPIALWAGRIILGLLFMFTGFGKLSGNPMMVGMFQKIGAGEGFRYLTGTIEICGGLLLLWPKTSFYAAIALLGVMCGALIVQTGILHGDFIHVLVIGGLVALVAWAQRPVGRNALGV